MSNINDICCNPRLPDLVLAGWPPCCATSFKFSSLKHHRNQQNDNHDIIPPSANIPTDFRYKLHLEFRCEGLAANTYDRKLKYKLIHQQGSNSIKKRDFKFLGSLNQVKTYLKVIPQYCIAHLYWARTNERTLFECQSV